jgi:hypothetical protein
MDRQQFVVAPFESALVDGIDNRAASLDQERKEYRVFVILVDVFACPENK